jgi:arsenate reductase (thioredoxin)
VTSESVAVDERPVRVLFLCTQNSARSQMAEALLKERGRGRIEAGSAGTSPAARVNPYAVEELKRRGIDWSGGRPRSVDDVADERWDIAITVCDNARETCPILPGRMSAHWGVFDPAAVAGDDGVKRAAFRAAAEVLDRRIDRLLSLQLGQLDEAALRRELAAIGEEEAAASPRAREER